MNGIMECEGNESNQDHIIVIQGMQNVWWDENLIDPYSIRGIAVTDKVSERPLGYQQPFANKMIQSLPVLGIQNDCMELANLSIQQHNLVFLSSSNGCFFLCQFEFDGPSETRTIDQFRDWPTNICIGCSSWPNLQE
jgi:hypothetical protein